MSTDDTRSPLAEAVRELRNRLGETQQEFAIRMGLSLGSIARYETNAQPSKRVMRKLKAVSEKSGFSDLSSAFGGGVLAQIRFSGEREAYQKLLSRAASSSRNPATTEQFKAALIVLLDTDPERRKVIGRVVRKAERINPELFPDWKQIPEISRLLESSYGRPSAEQIEVIRKIFDLLPFERIKSDLEV